MTYWPSTPFAHPFETQWYYAHFPDTYSDGVLTFWYYPPFTFPEESQWYYDPFADPLPGQFPATEVAQTAVPLPGEARTAIPLRTEVLTSIPLYW